MSGIAGVVLADGREVTAAFLDHIARSAMPRGFDGISQWHDGPAGLIRFHHATTPEAVGETQPLAGPSGTVIAFDGRLDNRTELLSLLGERGRSLADAADVAIALALYELRGEVMVKLLTGDWAIAAWHPAARRLFLARSPGGWRPLLWTWDGKRLGFATEPRALVTGLGMERRVNEAAFGEFMAARFVTDTDTFFADIQRLEQGGALLLEGGRIRTWHWHEGPFEDLSQLSEAEHVERFSTLFDEALMAVMRSATPVASHLSGGLDSSSAVARITELQRAGRIGQALVPVSARFPGEAQDETRWSSAVEAHCGITARVTGRDPYDLDAWGRWCADTLQLPVRPSAVEGVTGGMRIQREQGERVLLTGEGGDDWLSGTFAHFPDLLLRGNLVGLLGEAMSQFPQEPRWVALRRTGFLASAPVVSRSYRAKFLWPHLRFDQPIPDWIRPEWAARTGLEERWEHAAPSFDSSLFAQKQRFSNFALARRYTAHDPIMAYAEHHGIEMRHPFHNLRLAEFCMGASGRLLRRGGEKKNLLRLAMRGTLPELVRTRQDKAVFITSLIDVIDAYFRRHSPGDLLPVRMGWLDGNRIEAMFAPSRAWRAGGGIGPLERAQLGPLWFIVASDMWLRHAIGL